MVILGGASPGYKRFLPPWNPATWEGALVKEIGGVWSTVPAEVLVPDSIWQPGTEPSCTMLAEAAAHQDLREPQPQPALHKAEESPLRAKLMAESSQNAVLLSHQVLGCFIHAQNLCGSSDLSSTV